MSCASMSDAAHLQHLANTRSKRQSAAESRVENNAVVVAADQTTCPGEACGLLAGDHVEPGKGKRSPVAARGRKRQASVSHAF